jgi:hypothetical protein
LVASPKKTNHEITPTTFLTKSDLAPRTREGELSGNRITATVFLIQNFTAIPAKLKSRTDRFDLQVEVSFSASWMICAN